MTFRIREMIYLGKGVMPSNDPAALVNAFWAPILALPINSSVRRMMAGLSHPDTLRNFLAAPEPGVTPGERYPIENRGDCMGSTVPDGVKAVCDPLRSVRPNDLCAFVYTFGFLPKVALYLGAIDDPPIDHYAVRPKTLFCFFQWRPAQIVCVADVDLVDAHPIVSIESDRTTTVPRAPWDILSHPDMTGTAPLINPRPLPAPHGRHLPALGRDEARAFFRQIESVAHSQIAKGTPLDEIKRRVASGAVALKFGV